jgi:lipopolysaccharide export LptBFGC system permease protein LptF
VLSTLDRYVLKKLVRTFVPTLLCLGFLFFLGATFRLLKVEDLSLGQVTLALPWVLPFLLPYLVPLAWLIATTLTLGRMVADNEALAFTSLGIPNRSLAKMALVASIPLCVGSLWLTASFVPHCYQMRKKAGRAVFQQFLTLSEGEHLSRVFEREGFDIYVRRYGPQGLEGVVMHFDMTEFGDDPTGAQAAQLVAARGRIGEESRSERLVLTLEDVTITLQEPKEGRFASPPVRVHLERYVQAIGLSATRRIKPQDYSTADLRREIDKAAARSALAAAGGGVMLTQRNDDRPADFRVELAMRAAVALASLLLAAMGAPLAFLLRSTSPLVPFAAGLVAACGLYFAPMLLGRSLAESSGQASLVFLGCASSAVAAGALAWLVKRA